MAGWSLLYGHILVPSPTLSKGMDPRAELSPGAPACQADGEGRDGDAGHFGISKADTRGFTLKYWLNRITAYLRKSKSMVENWFWMRAQSAQKK